MSQDNKNLPADSFERIKLIVVMRKGLRNLV